MKSVPVKIEHEGKWIRTTMGIGEDRFRIDAPLEREVPYKSVVDLEGKKNQVVITAGADGEPSPHRLGREVLAVLKRFITPGQHRLNAFFMSPAIRGGAIQNAQ